MMGLIPFSKIRLNYYGNCYSDRQNLPQHVMTNSDISEEIMKKTIRCAERKSLRDDNV
jgi:hypothetical protein